MVFLHGLYSWVGKLCIRTAGWKVQVTGCNIVDWIDWVPKKYSNAPVPIIFYKKGECQHTLWGYTVYKEVLVLSAVVEYGTPWALSKIIFLSDQMYMRQELIMSQTSLNIETNLVYCMAYQGFKWRCLPVILEPSESQMWILLLSYFPLLMFIEK